ncbi:hypothetical protein KUF55_06270 [Paeniglutamicibacter sp. Y32M11]|nr:hypothetical protein [Paeniglutamicibacter sp. Y32M11]QXQ11486.1 hypothetical protein KUF55_06270 [Paeniglutamicibacter sp. Y32M11]
MGDPLIATVLTLLAEAHPEYATKFGSGIAHWIIQDNSDVGYTTVGYRAMLKNGQGPERFSYNDVLKTPSKWQNLQEALTKAADDITQQFREQAFANGPFECPVTGKLLERPTQARATHVSPSRRDLHLAFLVSEGIAASDVVLAKDQPGSGYRIVDSELVQRWRKYQCDRLGGMRVEWNPQSRSE